MELNYDKEREVFESDGIAKEYFASRSIRKDNYYVANLNSNRNKDKFYNGVIRMNAGWSAWQRRAEIAQAEEAKLQAQITELQQKLAKYENPDYVLVPREPTDEVCEIIALSAKVCGGIALDIYTAMIEEVEKSK